MLSKILRFLPKLPPRLLSRSTNKPPPPPPPEIPVATAAAAAAGANETVTREEAYRMLGNLDWKTATKILLKTPPKHPKFGLDFHLVQLFFVCLPSLAIYLVAQYSRYEMKRMEAEKEVKMKKAEEEEKAKIASSSGVEEESSDVGLSRVLVRLDALEGAVKELVEGKRKILQEESSKKQDQEANKKSNLQTKSACDEPKPEQKKVAEET